MISNRNADFVFLHIPKCAGTTIHWLFSPYDDFENFFLGEKEHPIIGRYDANHVPPRILREFFPETFSRISDIEKFAIMRDPYDRFRSSIAQRIRDFTEIDIQDVTPSRLERELEKVAEYMSRSDGLPKREFVHFMRQSDFIELDNERFVERIFSIEDTGLLVQELAGRLNVEVDVSLRANATNWRETDPVTRAIRFLRPVYRKILPGSVIRRGREMLEDLTNVKEPRAEVECVFETSSFQEFVSEFYSRDIELWAKMRQSASSGQ